ncbi:arylesterase [Croceibacterium aestuarii]|uniref:arylesterase n=1 Tax=Croceibacterium aestuarii TaxID=3064139 RepID=UPI00272E33BB|nr:arylesterase [Croceibacterium sp. D39]
MNCRSWSILAALALAACGSEAPPAPAETAGPEPRALAEPAVPVVGEERQILAFGDSLFAGYGLEKDEGYPERLEAALRARGINASVADAGLSGDTTAGGLQRIDFVLNAMQRPPDLALVELGGNDLLRGLSPQEAKDNLSAILDQLGQRKIPVVLYGMRAPPNAGPQYQRDFDAMYPALAKEYGATLVPFFLEPVYDKPELRQADRIHPTAEGIEDMVAATVDTVAGALPKS